MFGNGTLTALLLFGTIGLWGVAIYAYRRFRDPLHPAMFLGPLFFLGMVAEPAMSLRKWRWKS